MAIISRETADDIAIDSLLYQYSQLKKRAKELKEIKPKYRPTDEVLTIGRTLRSLEAVLEYYGISDIQEALILFESDSFPLIINPK